MFYNFSGVYSNNALSVILAQLFMKILRFQYLPHEKVAHMICIRVHALSLYAIQYTQSIIFSTLLDI